MAYDEELANRVREQLAREEALTEKAMFGGLAFLVGGNMAVAMSGDELKVRVGRDRRDDALELPHTGEWAMTGRPMKDWVAVDAEGVATDEGLREWIGRGVAFARSLPPKGG
jgi:TfoX/Sxy family transcriptional regulator of competence genes